MAKVICESCGSSFPLERVRNMDSCPVCGEALWGEDSGISDHNEEIDLEHPDMYFYSIDDEDRYENQDLRDVWCQCTSCRKVNTISYNKFSYIKPEYVKLKDGVEIYCKGCGKAVTNLAIPKRPDGWRELNMWEKDYENLPKCPVCSSTKIHRISMTSKAASAIAFGVLAAGHVSKTYKCDICGAKF